MQMSAEHGLQCRPINTNFLVNSAWNRGMQHSYKALIIVEAGNFYELPVSLIELCWKLSTDAHVPIPKGERVGSILLNKSNLRQDIVWRIVLSMLQRERSVTDRCSVTSGESDACC